MQTSLESYFLQLDGWLDIRICEEAIAALETGAWRKHSYTEPGKKGSSSFDDGREFDIAFGGNVPFDVAITRKMAMAVEYYTVRLQFPWFSPPLKRTEVRYNRYSTGHSMTEHCDHIQLDDNREGVMPVLSCLAILNDDYEGGELIMWGSKRIDTRAGTILVFPSNFLYPHRVEPIQSGYRYSCVTWSW